MDEFVFEYVCFNEFKKLEKALKKVNMLVYKKLIFEYYPALKHGCFIGNIVSSNKKNKTETYELTLLEDNKFAQIHGEIKLVYTVLKEEKVIILKTITPSELLLELFHLSVNSYKGVIISKSHEEKDKFKINLLEFLKRKK